MTFAELVGTTPQQRWRSLSPAAQERIGAKLIEWLFAELVADDDGTETSAAEREKAREISEAAFSDIDKVVEAEFPDVVWDYPNDMIGYELRDSRGNLLGRIDLDRAEGAYVYVPAGAGEPNRSIAPCMPTDCLPSDILQAVRDGGSCRPLVCLSEPHPIAA